MKINWPFETIRAIHRLKESGAMIAYIDLFCGAGGFSTGAEQAIYPGGKLAEVIVGINHDWLAIESHRINHPHTLHLVEDIRAVKLRPLANMVRAIRRELPYIKIVIWASAECTHHSRAKGGDSRDADSRSLPEELERYDDALKPDLWQIENVTEFREWGPLEQKCVDLSKFDLRKYRRRMEHQGETLISKNKKIWYSRTGLVFKRDKRGITKWMVPIKVRKKEYFNKWLNEMLSRGLTYQDKDINAADHGALTSRIRYYGQFSRTMPILWPEATHAKHPDKVFLKTGKRLNAWRAVKECLDFQDTGESVFVPGRIDSEATYERLLAGGIRFIAGSATDYKEKKDEYFSYLIKYNSTSSDGKNFDNCNSSINEPAPVVSTQNRLGKVHLHFITKFFSGRPEGKNTSIEQPAGTITTSANQGLVKVDVLPFIVQFNNNCDAKSIDQPSGTLTSKDKFALAFINQRNSGDPNTKIVSIQTPARTITSTGGNQELVQVQEILPFISTFHGSGHNCHLVTSPSPTVPAADTHAVVTPQPFITRDFTGGGQLRSIDDPAGTVMPCVKMNIVQPESWIMDTAFHNIGKSISEPAQTLTASRRHAYLVNPSFKNSGSSVEAPSPTVIAKQDKKPLHLAQVEFGDTSFLGIAIYETDTPAQRKLKEFMAVYGIADIKMRMLKETELLPIQGFPVDYFERVRKAGIKVSASAAKKYIGNSQEVNTATKLVEPYGSLFTNLFTEQNLSTA